MISKHFVSVAYLYYNLVAQEAITTTVTASSGQKYLRKRSKGRKVAEAAVPDNEQHMERVWIEYQDGEYDSAVNSLSTFSTQSAGRMPPIKLHYDLGYMNALVVSATDEELEIMRSDPSIKSVQVDHKRYPAYIKDSVKRSRHLQGDEGQVVPYGIDLIQSQAAWARGATGSGVKVCVIDTGMDGGHEDFATGQLTGFDVADGADFAWDPDPVGHGTHVSGTIAAANNTIGVVGVAPDAEIFTIRAFNDNGVFASDLIEAARECQANGAKIISMSLGGYFPNPFESSAFTRLYEDDGVLCIAAAGNDGNSFYNYPASYQNVISVAAVDDQKEVASFSQRNNRVDISAPGVDILSTLPMDGTCQICQQEGVAAYGTASGTSMATPHVAGVAAILWSDKPSADASDIREAILTSAVDLGEPGKDRFFGEGLVSAVNALAVLNGETPPIPDGPINDSPIIENPIIENPSNPITDDQEQDDCAEGEMFVEVAILADFYGNEISWQIVKDSTGVAVMADADLPSRQLSVKSKCLSSDCYTFTIYDSRSDGICCTYGEGSYSVKVDGKEIGSGGVYEDSESVSLGEACATLPNDPKPPIVDIPEDPIVEVPEDPVVEVPEDPVVTPDDPPVVTPDEPTLPCVDVELVVSTSLFPGEVSVRLENYLNPQEEALWDYGPDSFARGSTDYTATECIDPTGCHLFEITDSGGLLSWNTYELHYDGTRVGSGDPNSLHYLGAGCP